MSARGVLRIIEGNRLGFWCPGCDEMHVVDGGWLFDGNYEQPTFNPSVLVTSGHHSPRWKSPDCWCTYNKAHPDDRVAYTCSCCHSFVEQGRIRFLSDCTHKLAGQTISLQPF